MQGPYPSNEKASILKMLRENIGEELYIRVSARYHLDHLWDPQEPMSQIDLYMLITGIFTHTQESDLKRNPNLARLLEFYTPFIRPIVERLNASKTDKNKVLNDDLKTLSTVFYISTYCDPNVIDNPALVSAISSRKERNIWASGLHLCMDLAHCNLNHDSIIPALDEDGTIRSYKVYTITNDDKLVCHALIPCDRDQEVLDIKVIFRGTDSIGTFAADFDTTGPGSKIMRDNRIKLLKEVNHIVSDLQKSSNKPVSLSIQGHSLGGSYAERFTSEIHQAIYHQQNQQIDLKEAFITADLPFKPKTEAKTIKEIQSRLKLNQLEMKDRDFAALASLHKIKTLAAGSSRLSSKEARIGEGFIATNHALNGPKQEFRYFQTLGDPILESANRSLGAGFGVYSPISVSLLTKQAGYEEFSGFQPYFAHSDHPLRRMLDKNNANPISFKLNQNNSVGGFLYIRKHLASGLYLLRKFHKFYSKIPTYIAEPITYLRKCIAQAQGKDPRKIKGFEVVMEKNKRKNPYYYI